jgi:3',5'-nucleoside bisphosphate phosphatase
MSGQEFKTSDYGDVLVYGLKETIPKQKLSIAELKKKYPQSAVVWAHPYRHNKIPPREDLMNPLFDGIEILSSNYTIAEAARALDDWHRYKFTAIAGTDTHALSYTGSYPTVFDHPVTRIEEVVDELRKGRCRPFLEEIPHTGTTNTKITEVRIGPGIRTKEKINLIVKSYQNVEEWKEGERTHYIINEIHKYGFKDGMYRIPKPLDKDEIKLALIEESIPGITLYDKLLEPETEAEKYLKMTAGCLAELHNLKLKITSPGEYLPVEQERLKYYLNIFYEEGHPLTRRVQMIADEVYRVEEEIISDDKEVLIQGHGDFHPKNIYIANDEKTGEEYIALLDLHSSYRMLPEFDVGSFLAQYRNMFFDRPDFLYKYPPKFFLDEYFNKILHKGSDFYLNVQLYKARTYISILYYLVKVGKGETENFWTILVQAERSIAHISYNRHK